METVALYGQEANRQASEAAGAATAEVTLKVAGASTVSDRK